MPEARPNILIIMSDQHHAGVMGCAGDAVADTPSLDRLAAEGVRLSNTYCPCPLCGPSRMAFMTAQHPFGIDCWTNESAINPDTATFAHAFLAAGYETVLAGRMHFVGGQQRHGFVKRLIGDVPESGYLEAGWKLDRVVGPLRDTCGSGANAVIKSGPGRTGYQAYDRAVTQAAVDWLTTRRDGNQPFLLTVGFILPHCPFVAPAEDFDYFAERISPADLPPPDEHLHPVMAHWRRSAGVDPPPPLDAQWRARVAYYGMCRMLDRNIAAILDALDHSGQADNTLVVYTSDHGEMLGEHGLWWKSTFYDGACRVPLLMRWPQHLPAGTARTENVSLIDIGPTLLDLAGAGPIPDVSGTSFRRLVDPTGDPWPDVAMAEYVYWSDDGLVPARMIRKGPWKCNLYHAAAGELFNLADDGGELRNRWNDLDLASIQDALIAQATAGWDSAAVLKRCSRMNSQRPLIGQWITQACPPEPDAVWFDAPPENTWDQTRRPKEPRRGN